MGAELFYADGMTDRHDKTEKIASRNFMKTPKKKGKASRGITQSLPRNFKLKD